ncbi:MAG TPA: hypothetical protein VF044_10555, partial [Actinomycetota bacterium]
MNAGATLSGAIAGGAGVNAVVGGNAANAWTIDSDGGGTLNGVAFSAIGTLTGGSNVDRFVLAAGGSVAGTIAGGAGNDELVGPNATRRWTITGAGAGTVGGQAFAGMENLTGGSAIDIFDLEAGAALTGTISGGATDAVDVIERDAPGANVNVTASGAGTANTVRFAGIENVNLVFGNAGDRLRATYMTNGVRIEPLFAGDFVAAVMVSTFALPSLTISTWGGDDSVMVDSIPLAFVAPIALETGAGDDEVLVAAGAAAAPRITVDGGPDTDVLQDLTLLDAAKVSNFEIIPYGIPKWLEEGPGPIESTRASNTPTLPHTGSINSIAVHPFDDNIIYVGTVNGGVWVTVNGGTTWRPLTDALPSLAIGAVAIAPWTTFGEAVDDETVTAELVLYASTGSFSSFRGRGGLSIGLLYSDDGGATWTIRSSAVLAGIRLTAVVPMVSTSTDENAQIVLVAGLDAGQTTGALARDAAADTVRRQLEVLSNVGVGNVEVTGGPLPGTLTVTFRNRLGGRDVPELQARALFNGGVSPSVSISTTTQGAPADPGTGTAAVDEVQTIAITGNPLSGTFTLTFADTGARKGGVFRSTDSGASFARVLAGSVSDLVADPGKPGRAYAGVVGSGVYRSDDWGATWNPISGATLHLRNDNVDNDRNGVVDDAGEGPEGSERIVLAVRQNSGSEVNPVYAGLLSPHVMGIFTSTPNAACCTHGSWSLVGNDAPPPPTNAAVTGTPNYKFLAGNELQRTSGNWRTDGFAKGQLISVGGAAVAGNNGQFVIDAVVSDTVIRLKARPGAGALALTADAAAAAARALTIGVLEFAPDLLTDVQPQVSIGRQAGIHFGLVVDGAGNVYVAGDRGVVEGGYAGNLYVFTASNGEWKQLSSQAGDGTNRPHADHRELYLSETARGGSPGANVGFLWTATDGGLYRLDLSATPRAWENKNGSGTGALRTIELTSVAYDALNDILFGGAQDNGFAVQRKATDGVDSNGNSLIDEAAEQLPWGETIGGDGNVARAVSVLIGGQRHVIRFSAANNLTSFRFDAFKTDGTTVAALSNYVLARAAADAGVVFTVDAGDATLFRTAADHGLVNGATYMIRNTGGALPGGTFSTAYYSVQVESARSFKLKLWGAGNPITTTSRGTGTQRIFRRFGGLEEFDRNQFSKDAHQLEYEPNAVDPNRMLLGLYWLYESNDRFDSILSSARPFNTEKFSALAYGGTSGGHGRWEVIYAAGGNDVLIRLPRNPDPAHADGMTIDPLKRERILDAREIRDLVLDPDDYNIAYAATDVGVFKRNPGACDANGCRWDLISQNLFNANLQAIEFVKKEHLRFAVGETPKDVLLVGGVLGVHRAFDPAPNVEWIQLGSNLPNALVSEIVYHHVTAAEF